MKVLLIIFLCVSSYLSAQNVLTLFKYLDEEKFAHPIFLPDGKTPVPDSCLVEICSPAQEGVYSYEKDFHGKELQNLRTDFFFNGEKYLLGPGYFFCDFYFIWLDKDFLPEEPAVHCGEKIYFRIYNAADPSSATHFCHSAFIQGPAAGSPPGEIEISQWQEWELIKK
ncbi:MAG: hypothetical protein JXB60_09455 [Candidatus Cloacimonetes bacterium]|nr:hypothetical protein [Candidatus Cloacimonadota bacterium]